MKAKFKDSHTLIVSEFNKTEDILANNMLECSSIANVSISKDTDSHSILSLTSRPLNTLDIYPSIEKQQFNGLYNIVNVNPVTASIDKNIKPENIRKGVDILGISGTMLERKLEETVTIDLDLSSGNQTVKPGDENSVLSEVTINRPDTLISSNIRKDINIAGIVGSLIDLDTSDATASNNDIISPKTAYVNGQKVTGAMIPTYDSSVPSELGRNINLSGITIDDVNLDINLAIRASSGSSIEIYDIINDTISSETKTVINLTALTDTSVIKGTGRFNTTITMVNNKEYIRCYLMTKSSTTAYYVYSFLLNLQDKTIINEALVSIGEGGSHAISLVVVPDKDIVISSTTGKNGGYLFTRVYFVYFNDTSGTASKIIDNSQNGLAGSSSVARICVAPDKRTIGIFNHFNYMSFGTGTRAFTCVIRVSTDGTSYSTIQSNTLANKLCMLIDENTFIQDNSIKQIGTQALLGTSPFTVNYGDRGILIGKYFYYLPSGSNNYSVYEWDSNEKTFTAVSTLTTNGGAILHFAKEILYKNTDNALTGYVNDSTKGALMALYRNNTTFYNTQYANDISASNVLKNKKYFDINGLGIGTMPNNGTLNYTPSEQEQTIPAGYTSGGTVSAAVMTNDDYQTCIDLADYIMYGGEPPLPYTELEYIQGTGTQWIDTGITMTGNSKIELKYKSSTTSTNAICGTAWSAAGIFLMTYGGKYRYHYNNVFNDVQSASTFAAKVFVMASNTISIDEVSYTVGSIKSGSFNKHLGLFLPMTRGGNSNEGPGSGNLYYCKLYENDILVSDFIPVKRKDDGVICLYDKVSKQFLLNQGTGNFIAGPERS